MISLVGRNHLFANSATGLGLCLGLAAMSKSGGLLGSIAIKAGRFIFPVEPGIKLVVYTVAAIALFLFGTLLPDIDSKKSTLGRYVHLPVRHRTITHTIWVVALLFALGIKFRAFLFLALGYMLHIFYDGLSSGGIAWFWPFSRYITYPGGATVKKGFRFKFYKTGEASETIVLIVICVFWLCVSILSLIKLFSA